MSDDLRRRYLSIHDLVRAARERLDDGGWGYLAGGTETETTLRRNRLALDRIALRPRVLNDVSKVDATTRFLGHKLRLPVLLAPVGGLETFDPEGALAVARAAGEFGVPKMLSSVSPRTKREVREAGGPASMFQLYVREAGRFIEDHVEATIAAGMAAFCFTVDTAHYSRRERDLDNRFAKPWRAEVSEVAIRSQAALCWRDIARVRKAFAIPLILKGIATHEDARMALEHGIDVIYVSNHGGRQLDHGRGTMDVLPEIVETVKGRALVVVDGGFCRGTDILKALACGADLVGLGRLYCYGLAAAGSAGIVRLLEILEDELIRDMGLIGVTRLAEVGPKHIYWGAPPVTEPHGLSAFPLLPPI
jgi:glycolate oxidase